MSVVARSFLVAAASDVCFATGSGSGEPKAVVLSIKSEEEITFSMNIHRSVLDRSVPGNRVRGL
jgi:hypothetical protein